MPRILIREIEPDIIQRLKDRAKRNGRSLEDELRFILIDAAEEHTATITPDMVRIREMLKGCYFSDSAESLRDDRER